MIRTGALLFLVALLALLGGCGMNVLNLNIVGGSGNVRTESREVSNLNGVALSGTGELTITQGDTESLTIEAEDNLLPLLTSDVQNGTLFLGVKAQTTIVPTRPILYKLSVKNLNSIGLSGTGLVQTASLKSDHLSLSVSGSGNINVDHLEANDITVILTGTGNVNIGGQVTSQNITLSGMGGYRAADLQSDSGRITVSGAGGATVWTASDLDVTISGAGSVGYYGSPKIAQHISGVGQVSKQGDK